MLVESLHRYPIKSLQGDTLPQASIIAGRGIPNDRRFGFAFRDTGALLSGAEKWQPWQYLVSLKKYNRLAHLRAAFDDNTQKITVWAAGKIIGGGEIDDAPNIRQLCQAVANYIDSPPLHLIDSDAVPLWDDAIALTLLSTATLADFSDVTPPFTVARFRPNLVFSGLAAWEEMAINAPLQIGEVVLQPGGGVPRCAATRVNPHTAESDLNAPAIIYKKKQHNELGIFATIKSGGVIAAGMAINISS